LNAAQKIGKKDRTPLLTWVKYFPIIRRQIIIAQLLIKAGAAENHQNNQFEKFLEKTANDDVLANILADAECFRKS